MKVDSPPPVAIVGGSGPTPATNRAGQKPAQFTPSSASADVQDHSLSSSNQLPEQLAVGYQLAENRYRVSFKVVDENTGQFVRQVPASAVLSGEEQFYQLLEKQSGKTGKG